MDPLINNEKYIYLHKKYISYQLKSSYEYDVYIYIYVLVLNIYCNILCSFKSRIPRLTRRTSGEIWRAPKLVWPSEQLPGISLSSWVCSLQNTPRSVEVRDCRQQKSLILLKYLLIITISSICLINNLSDESLGFLRWFIIISSRFTTDNIG